MKTVGSRKDLLECAFGEHDFNSPEERDIFGAFVHFCKRCRRVSRNRHWENEYDSNRNLVYRKSRITGYGQQHFYTKDGVRVRWIVEYKSTNHHTPSGGWYHNGRWVIIKPENWEYEGQI